MAEQMTATVKLETGMRFDAEAGSGHHITLDAAEHGGGQNTGFRPMELLLVGLGGCTGMDVISILRKKRQQVTGYEVHVSGIRAEEKRYCGAGAMLGKVAHLRHTFHIVEVTEAPTVVTATQHSKEKVKVF